MLQGLRTVYDAVAPRVCGERFLHNAVDRFPNRGRCAQPPRRNAAGELNRSIRRPAPSVRLDDNGIPDSAAAAIACGRMI